MDERQWLLSSAYNTGIECLQSVTGTWSSACITNIDDSACSLDEARRWFEASTVICRFVPDGKSRAEKVSCDSTILRQVLNHVGEQISETYSYLLSRYHAPNDRSVG